MTTTFNITSIEPNFGPKSGGEHIPIVNSWLSFIHIMFRNGKFCCQLVVSFRNSHHFTWEQSAIAWCISSQDWLIELPPSLNVRKAMPKFSSQVFLSVATNSLFNASVFHLQPIRQGVMQVWAIRRAILDQQASSSAHIVD